MDLYQFIFTSIDIDIRSRFIADFVCSVYYDSFAKTIANINSNIQMFSMGDFIKEFNDKIFLGFVFAAEVHTWMVKEAWRKCPEKHSRYTKLYSVKLGVQVKLFLSLGQMSSSTIDQLSKSHLGPSDLEAIIAMSQHHHH